MTNQTTQNTITNVKKTLTEVNNDINSQIDNLCRESTGLNDFDKKYLRTIRDENIATLKLIYDMELKGMI